MSVRRLAVVSVAVSLVAAVLLAGCAEDPEPRFEEPTSSPAPTEAETSEAGRAQTPEEFIREWFEINTAMQNSGDATVFRRRSTGCKPCIELANQVERFYDQGGFVRIENQTVEKIDKVSRHDYRVVVDAAQTTYRASESARERKLRGGPNEYRMQLRRAGTNWVVSDYQDTPS